MSPLQVEDILDAAERTAFAEGHDAAARNLAQHRISTAERLGDDITQLLPLVRIVTSQAHHMTLAGYPERALGAIGWLLHVYHHAAPEITPPLEAALREPMSSLLMRNAQALWACGKYADSRLSVRNALDLTRVLPVRIVSAIQLYTAGPRPEVIEGTPYAGWLSDRIAEFLASLDFAGLDGSPFRIALDAFQNILQNPQERGVHLGTMDGMAEIGGADASPNGGPQDAVVLIESLRTLADTI